MTRSEAKRFEPGRCVDVRSMTGLLRLLALGVIDPGLFDGVWTDRFNAAACYCTCNRNGSYGDPA